MCIFCAAVPVAGAVGAKLSADQKHKIAEGNLEREKPIAAITGGVVVALILGSVVYHTTLYGKS